MSCPPSKSRQLECRVGIQEWDGLAVELFAGEEEGVAEETRPFGDFWALPVLDCSRSAGVSVDVIADLTR